MGNFQCYYQSIKDKIIFNVLFFSVIGIVFLTVIIQQGE